jgi:hypothetical protein
MQRAAGNRALARTFGHGVVLQRQITIGQETFTVDEAREFRRTLMLELKARGFRELGTRGMWDWVDRALSDDDPRPTDWDSLIGWMVGNGLLDKPLPQSGVARGPRRLGERPSWSPQTAALIRDKRGAAKGMAARHVIASSTLGAAIERSSASPAEMRLWLQARDVTPPTEESRLRRAIWTTVHNFAGNLWMGPTQANTAIGFIRDVLMGIRSKLPMSQDGVDIAKTQALIRQRMVEGGQDNERNRTWNLLLADLAAELDAYAPPVAREDVADLIDMYYRNADIDPPTLVDDEYGRVVKVWSLLQDQGSVLEGLTLLMEKPLRHSIAG